MTNSSLSHRKGIVLFLKWTSLKESFEKSDEDLKTSESQIQKFTLEVTQATNEQLKSNEKIKPLREKEIEAAAKLNRINLERDTLDQEEERIKDEKKNLENSIQQIISDNEREQFQLEDAIKDLEALKSRRDTEDNGQNTDEISNETIDQLKVEKEKLTAFLNGERLFEIEDDVLRGGKVGLSKFRETEAQFKNFDLGKNLAPKTIPIEKIGRASCRERV